MRKGFFDVRSSVFRPLWLRIAIAGGCILWALYELSSGAVFWAILFGAAGLYLFHEFFLAWEDPETDKDEKGEAE